MTDMEMVAVLELLRQNLQVVQIPPDTPDAGDFIRRTRILGASVNPLSGVITGFLVEHAMHVVSLATALRDENPNFVVGTNPSVFEYQTLHTIIDLFQAEPDVTVEQRHLDQIRGSLATWLTQASELKTFFVPCAITPRAGNAFDVGPVNFRYRDKFIEDAGKHMNPAVKALIYGEFMKALDERYGNWVAQLDIQHREPERASDVADTAVDLAITTLKIIFPGPLDRAHRVTARAIPAWRTSTFVTATSSHPGVENLESGRLISEQDFNAFTKANTAFFTSAGRCIEAYIRGGLPFQTLMQAWCDAAYWFNEAVMEPYETVAVAKYETSIENLMRAENAKGSNKRIRTAFKAFFDLEPEDNVAGLFTVESLAEDIVTARSRVYHGTLSTLVDEPAIKLMDAKAVANALLIHYILGLDLYMAAPGATDDISAFLAWVSSNVPKPSKSQVGITP